MSKLDGIKAGDRVRVTFEGVVDEIGPPAGARVSADADWVWIGDRKNKSDDHFQITRIEPAFKVGDIVQYQVFTDRLTTQFMPVLAILSDGRLVVEYQAGDSTNVMARDPSCFKRA